MSKRNMLLGLAAGKVGDLVFYRDGGEQRTRTRVIPKNPRSLRQMSQRVKIANVSATYRALKSILSESFANRPSNQSGYNAFAKDAIVISPYLRSEMVKAGGCAPAPYTISRGTLQRVFGALDSFADVSRITLPVNGLVADGATIGSISSAIINQFPSIQNGDKVVFVLLQFNLYQTGGVDVPMIDYQSVVTVEIDTTSTSSLLPSNLIVEDDTLAVAGTDTNAATAGAVFVSRVDGNGQLDVSPSVLELNENAFSMYEDYTSDNAKYNAVESYGVGSQSLLRETD